MLSPIFICVFFFFLQAEEEEEESAAGIRLESDEVENVTRSSLGLVPSIEDDGEKITCKAENPWVPRTFVEDSWVLHVVCKTSHKSFFQKTQPSFLLGIFLSHNLFSLSPSCLSLSLLSLGTEKFKSFVRLRGEEGKQRNVYHISYAW